MEETADRTVAFGKKTSKAGFGNYQALMGYVFIAPALILFLIFTVLPAFTAFYLSFTSYDVLTPAQWIGLANYQRLLTDVLFQTTLRNVATYCLLYVPLIITLSLLVALALNRKRPGMKFFRTIYYLPVISSPVAAATVWLWVLNKDYGALNQMLAAFGIQGPAWVANINTAMLSIVLVTLWQGLGGNMVIYLAGLQGIPEYLYEAARLDGAGSWQLFRFITWPSLRTTTFLVTTLSLIGAFQLFDQAYVLTQGGPANATRTVVYQIWEVGFNRLRMGYASAMAVILFAIIFIVTMINLRINNEQTMVME